MCESIRSPCDRRCQVLGLGSGIPALVAAKAGADVVWAERIERLADVCAGLASTNKLSKKVCVLRGASWEEMDWAASGDADRVDKSGAPPMGFGGGLGGGGFGPGGLGGTLGGGPGGGGADTWRFDSVITEEISDDLVGDGLLEIARLARRNLLRPGGTFYPKKAIAYAALASVRITDVEGFDARPWNVFRSTDPPVYDMEEVPGPTWTPRQQPRRGLPGR